MENPFMAIGLLQEAQARARYHDDWEQDYLSLQEQSDRNQRSRAIWNALTSIVQLFRRPTTALRGAHA
jgi:hypothetical protein